MSIKNILFRGHKNIKLYRGLHYRRSLPPLMRWLRLKTFLLRIILWEFMAALTSTIMWRILLSPATGWRPVQEDYSEIGFFAQTYSNPPKPGFGGSIGPG